MNFETPFREELKPTECDSRVVDIRKLKSCPDILVRECQIETNENADTLASSLSEGKKQFDFLSSKYDLNIISFNSVIGRNEKGEDAIFTIVDKIEGQSLEDIEIIPIEAKEELDNVFASLANHYYDAWKDDTKYWADGNSSQFMYGHKVKEDNDHVYLVDVDPLFCKQKENINFPIEWPIYNTCKGIVDVENKFENNTRLEKARATLHNTITTMLKQDDANQWLRKSLTLLSDK